MTAAKVAVVVRTKDRPMLLERALRSVAAQEFADWQLVLVNDSDDPDSVRGPLESTGLVDDDRLLLLHVPAPHGRSAAANRGFLASDSELLTIHDDDDTWDPDFLATTVAYLDANPGQVGVATRAEVVLERIDDDGIVEERREILAQAITDASLIGLAIRNFIPTNSLVLRRSVQEQVGLFDLGLPVLEDWDFLIRLLSRGPLGFLPDRPLAFWHQRPHSGEGPDSNSVVSEALDHERFDPVVRDRYVRRDLEFDGDGQPIGLGTQLALAQQLRELSDRSMLAWDAQSALTERWGRDNEQWGRQNVEQVRVFALDVQLEVGRLRGEVLAMRDLATRLGATVDHLSEVVRRISIESKASGDRSERAVDEMRIWLEERAAQRRTLPGRGALTRLSRRMSVLRRHGSEDRERGVTSQAAERGAGGRGKI